MGLVQLQSSYASINYGESVQRVFLELASRRMLHLSVIIWHVGDIWRVALCCLATAANMLTVAHQNCLSSTLSRVQKVKEIAFNDDLHYTHFMMI